MHKKISLAVLISAAIFLASCAGNVTTIRKNADLSKYKRIGISAIKDYAGYPNSGSVARDMLSKYFIISGFEVLETPENGAYGTVQQIPVDLVITGSITMYNPESRTVVVSTRREQTEETTFDGKTSEKDRPDRMRASSVIVENAIPSTYIVNAEIGLLVKMTDTSTGQVICTSSYSYDASNIHTAIENTAEIIVDDITETWKDALKAYRR